MELKTKCLLSTMLIILISTMFFKEPFNIQEQVEAKNPTPIFYVSFDDTVVAQIAGGNPEPSGVLVHYVDDGIRGKALGRPADSGYKLYYGAPGNLNPGSGTIEFWIRIRNPQDAECTFFSEEGGNKIYIGQPWPESLIFRFFNDSAFLDDSAGYRGWVGEWHQIAFTWNFSDIAVDGYFCNTTVYIDGYYKPYSKSFIAPPIIGDKFYVGYDGSNKRAYADIDELKIYDVALTEEEIRKDYMALFPVEYYAKETVFKYGGITQPSPTTLDVDITNIREGFLPSIKGKFRCQVDSQPAGFGYQPIDVELDEGETATSSVPFVLPNIGEHNLTCSFIPEGSTVEGIYNRTIKLFVIDGRPRPSREILYLKPILSIDCVNNMMETYPYLGDYIPTYMEDVGQVKVKQIQSPVRIGPAEYCDTGYAGIGEMQSGGKYRHSGPYGHVNSQSVYYNASYNDFPNQNNVRYDDDQSEKALDGVEYELWDFDIPSGFITGDAMIVVWFRIDAKKIDNQEAYISITASGDGGSHWYPEGPCLHLNSTANDPTANDWKIYTCSYDRWANGEHPRYWERSDLSDPNNFRVKITFSGASFWVDWIAVKIKWISSGGYYSRFAYKFNVPEPNNPHLVIVTYPDDKERIMGIDLSSYVDGREPDAFFQIETGVFTGGEYPNTNDFKRHTIFFWPRNDIYMITFVNWLPSFDIEQQSPGAAAKQIDVYEIEGNKQTGWFPKTEPFIDGGRMLGLWWEDAFIIDSFGGRNFSYPEFHRIVLNAMDYLHFTGQNLIVYPVWQYNQPHYPSRAERNIATQGFRITVHPYPYDWLELLLKVAEVNEINVITSLTITQIPSLEIRNDYHPAAIKNAVLATVNDILEQYGDYPSFKGISLNIWTNTINKYFLPPEVDGEYINILLGDINTKIQQARPDLKLIVSCWDPGISVEDRVIYGAEIIDCHVEIEKDEWDLDEWMDAWLGPKETPIYNMYNRMGLDMEQLQKPDNDIRIERVIRLTSCREQLTSGRPANVVWPGRQFILDGEGYEGCYTPFIKKDNTAATIFNGYFEGNMIKRGIPLMAYGAIDGYPCPWRNLEKPWHAGAITPGHKYFMENYMLVMTHLDPVQIGNGGHTVGTVGHEKQIQEFAKAFRGLPAQSFETVKDTNKAQVRDFVHQPVNQYYFYLINKKPDPVQVTLKFDTDDFYLWDLIAKTETHVSNGINTGITIPLAPYELRSYWVQQLVDISDVTTQNVSPQHDVRVRYVTVPHREAYPGWPVKTVISNVGDHAETANVTVYLNEIVIGTSLPAVFDPDSDNEIIVFLPEDMPLYVNHTLRVEVTPVSGETVLGDNLYIYGYIVIKKPGDVNCDEKINILDMYPVARAFGSNLGDPRYDVKADIVYDNTINIKDIYTVAKNFGWVFPK